MNKIKKERSPDIFGAGQVSLKNTQGKITVKTGQVNGNFKTILLKLVAIDKISSTTGKKVPGLVQSKT